ncbi:MAG: PEPxxWA-CTERM sorting domain-containing protein [Polymorphobacter sp.]|uniref:PEPxxWA-CTERM sorting domain-containing protein n=1 Tax=Polymorphobacter sp. TaxID=1909290 RepID=UPI003A88D596
MRFSAGLLMATAGLALAGAAQATTTIDFEDAAADDTLVTPLRYNELGISFMARPGLDLFLEQRGTQTSPEGFVYDRAPANTDRFDVERVGFVPTAETPGLGNYLLRGNTLSQTLEASTQPFFSILYLRRVVGPIGGQIWDIDGTSASNTEQWRVDARNSSGALLGSVLSPLGNTNGLSSLDGLPWSFGFDETSPFLGQIARLDFVFTGGKSTGLGVAFDNFASGTGPDAPVPEPASWAMLIAGFGLVGAAARRRRRQGVVIA